ncbi:class I SAM-dependent methyltransferase [Phaeacidiphilus oryzae]|uniref:class I SAM-dependent methyltransferase n=1 Tax=Phaeacidiphilus oryzae TaxID=348818 RepID=UPI000B2E6FC0|nr:class I SAM-dependent methyltransferase [Phaeacidiphilus oryzae]
MTTGEIDYNDYEAFARVYARNSESNPINALYERPAILALAGDVRGRRVLDAGCGPGAHSAELIDGGAEVTGLDLSADLLAVARERLGPDVPLHRLDLRRPLPFPDGAFELVLCSLVLHYLEEWGPTLSEFRRLLVPGGRVVLSTHHPLMDMRVSGSDDYFGRYAFTEDWQREGRTMHMRFWHRPLRDMLAAFAEAGFVVDEIREPNPLPEMAESAPEFHRHLTRNAQFLFFALSARFAR